MPQTDGSRIDGPQTLEVRIERRVATVWLARDAVRNAFNETMIGELDRSFERLGADDGVRAIVLAGRGAAFCAGADLDWMRRMSHYTIDENQRDARGLAGMLQRISTCPKPVIARVHGDAYAGGVGLVAACDLARASADAGFCLSETRLGLVPATIAPYVLRAIGARAALRYFLTAERFDSAEALRIGLIHEACAPGELDQRVAAIISALELTSAAAVRAAKALVHDLAGPAIDEALIADTAQRIAQARSSADGREGVQSFLEKRKPRWVVERNLDDRDDQGDAAPGDDDAR
jgi:methylglutaconyl-CoA hydratase